MVYHRNVGHHSLAVELRKQMQQLPSGDPHAQTTGGFDTALRRAGLYRAKSRSPTGERVPGDVPGDSLKGAIPGKDPDNPRHQPTNL